MIRHRGYLVSKNDLLVGVPVLVTGQVMLQSIIHDYFNSQTKQ